MVVQVRHADRVMLLTGDLEYERPEQSHGRQLLEPRARVEIRAALDQVANHGVGLPKMRLGSSQLSRVFIVWRSSAFGHGDDLTSALVAMLFDPEEVI